MVTYKNYLPIIIIIFFSISYPLISPSLCKPLRLCFGSKKHQEKKILLSILLQKPQKK